MTNYTNESIRSLSDREAVRLRPANILGSDDINGCFHCLVEIVDNAVDEAKGGFGDRIIITKHKDNYYSVRDFGRGVPMDWNKTEGKFNYELIFQTLYAGGKYVKDDGKGYEFAKGLNGLGAAATAFTSKHMIVESYRDGYKYSIEIQNGEVIGQLKKERFNYDSTGTYIKWQPDLAVFTETNIPFEWILEYGEQQAIVNKGITLIVVNEETGERREFYYENGIVDYINKLNNGKNFTDVVYWETEAVGRDREDRKEYKSRYEIAFCFNNEVNVMESYHNSSYLKHGGSPHEAIKAAFTYAIDKLIKQNGGYKKNEKKITWDDVRDSLVIITNTYSTETSYQNQTKFAITNKFIREFMTSYIKQQLEVYFIENPIEAEKIMNQVLINKRSREKAEQTRLDVKKTLQSSIDNLTNRIEGFVNCTSKDPDKTELYIVEGKSALGSLKQGRDADFQAIYPLRGKILNCLKADYDKIFKNETITDLIKILGCGIEIKNKHTKGYNLFNLNDLRWSKIIIGTDSDVDGFHIRTLILTMFYKLMPTLIREGYIYIAESPLYEISTPDDKLYYAYTDQEKDQILQQLNSKNVHVQRNKGLGEATAETMWVTMMNPRTRKITRVTEDDAIKANQYFEMFLGDDLEGRKEYIETNLHKFVRENLD